MQSFWNERYSAAEYAYGTHPNVFFKTCLPQIPVGNLLLPAEGEGRNAVFAARQGWQVQAFDYSEAGMQKAQALAASQGVEISYSVYDIRSFPWETATFDAVGLFFVHVPPDLRQFLHAQVIRTLKPGGHLILEAFAPAQIQYQSGGPRDVSMLYTPELLQQDFQELEIILSDTLITTLEEGPYHAGTAAVTRLFAKKA